MTIELFLTIIVSGITVCQPKWLSGWNFISHWILGGIPFKIPKQHRQLQQDFNEMCWSPSSLLF